MGTRIFCRNSIEEMMKDMCDYEKSFKYCVKGLQLKKQLSVVKEAVYFSVRWLTNIIWCSTIITKRGNCYDYFGKVKE